MIQPGDSPGGAAPALPVAVIGGGITGLVTAWRLRSAGWPVVLFEASGRAGGAIRSLRDGEWLHEAGPNSILLGEPADAEFLDAIGMGGRVLDASAGARRRYIVRRGRLEAMPASPSEFLRTRLFSFGAKLRLPSEIFRGRGAPGAGESVAAFTVRRLGREFLDYAVDPLVAGVYAGDPSRLSVRHAFPKLHALEQEHGSLIRGAVRKRAARAGPAGRMVSFPDGLEELPQALAARLDGAVRLGARVIAVRRPMARWRVTYEQGGMYVDEPFSAVVCAVPAPVLAQLRFDNSPYGESLAELAEIEHPPVDSVLLGFRRRDVQHPLDGFGFLVPKLERRSILGTLFSSTLFPGRCPADCVALTTFVGGMRQPELAGLDDGALVRAVRAELAALLGVRGGPVYVSIRRHPQAIPQYNVGFSRYQLACSALEAAAPGLFIGGSARDGISLSACLASGRRLADAVVTHLSGSGTP